MGLDQSVTFAAWATPAWPEVCSLLAERGFPVQVRMIDGAPAFPDEMPPEGWRELRLGTPQGMVTVRREQDRLVFVTWGNADAFLLQAWNALTWAFAAAGNGRITSAHGELTAAEFQGVTDLPAVLCPESGEPK